MTSYEHANVAIGLATIGVLAWTLYWVRRYTKAADRTADAAVEQAEAVQKPCIVVIGVPAKALHAAAESAWKETVDRRPKEEASYGQKVKVEPPRFENIGSGPALKVRVILERQEEGRWSLVGPPAEVGHVKSHGTFDLALIGPLSGDDLEYRLTAGYESLSARSYESEQRIQSGWLGAFEFRSRLRGDSGST